MGSIIQSVCVSLVEWFLTFAIVSAVAQFGRLSRTRKIITILMIILMPLLCYLLSTPSQF